MIFSDLHLARQLERAEASSNAAFVEARARLFPESGAEWQEMAGAYAMFDGTESPITQTFGLGLFEEAASADLEHIEAFFKQRHAPVMHEVSPLAHPSLWPLLGERGYRPLEFTSVLYQDLQPANAPLAVAPGLTTRLIEAAEAPAWAETAAIGWQNEAPELVDFVRDYGRITAAALGMHCFVAEQHGEPIATAGLYLHGGVALLAGASTVPAARGQGAQAALLAARLQYAAEHGCTLATMGALPGSQSQRNAERRGFRIAYTRTKWQLAQ